MVRNKPFPHLVWDSFLEDDMLKAIYDEFPNKDSELWTWKTNDKNSIKYMCQDKNLLSDLKNIYELIKYLNGDYFCRALGFIFGIPNLVSDTNLAGGGLHMIGKGGFLKVHADFNVADTMSDYHRRLNLILYLSDDWESEYNGDLEFWKTDLSECVVKLAPIKNRLVCFNTQPNGDTVAYHGHPKPLNTPSDVYRKSIALYYYTRNKPNNVLAEKHKTLYMDVS